jgi:CheY-like chemotaxis protein
MSDARDRSAPRRRVIVAEDDPFMRQLVVAALERDGYLVEEVRSGIGLHDELFSRITRGERRP